MSTEHPTNPKIVKELRGKREPKKIQIETYANVLLDSSERSDPGVLPKSSREQTPMEEEALIDSSEKPDSGVLPKSSREQTPMDEVQSFPGDQKTTELKFFSGNPFVEQTTGILHLYKNK